MAEGACVVAKHGSLANAESAAALDMDDAAGFERLGRPSTASRPDVTSRFPPAAAASSITACARTSRSRRVIPGRIAAATTAVGRTL